MKLNDLLKRIVPLNELRKRMLQIDILLLIRSVALSSLFCALMAIVLSGSRSPETWKLMAECIGIGSALLIRKE